MVVEERKVRDLSANSDVESRVTQVKGQTVWARVFYKSTLVPSLVLDIVVYPVDDLG